MKGKFRLIEVISVLAILVVTMVAACGGGDYSKSADEDFDDWQKVEWDFSGVVYLLPEEDRGQVLCLGGTGQTLPVGSDEVGIDLRVPEGGAIVSFDYLVCPSWGACFEVIEPGAGFRPWLTVYDKTDGWESARFLAPDADSFRLLFKAKRISEGGSGIIACLDNFKFSVLPTPIPPTPTPMGDTAPTPGPCQ